MSESKTGLLNVNLDGNSNRASNEEDILPMGEASSPSLSTTLYVDDTLANTLHKVKVLEAFFSAVTRNSTFEEFTRDILVALMDVVKCEAASILEVDQNNSSLFFRSAVGTSSDQLVDFIIPIGQGIAGHVAESRLPLVVDDVSENRVHLKSVSMTIGFEARNVVCIPIVIRGRIFGVFELLNRLVEATFTVSDVELLTYLSGMAAKAIETRLMISWSRNQFGSSSVDQNHQEAA